MPDHESQVYLDTISIAMQLYRIFLADNAGVITTWAPKCYSVTYIPSDSWNHLQMVVFNLLKISLR